jgi:hypothetical protein
MTPVTGDLRANLDQLLLQADECPLDARVYSWAAQEVTELMPNMEPTAAVAPSAKWQWSPIMAAFASEADMRA